MISRRIRNGVLIIHKSGEREAFEDNATAWYAIEDRYPGAILRGYAGEGTGIFAMHDLSVIGLVNVKVARRIVARVMTGRYYYNL